MKKLKPTESTHARQRNREAEKENKDEKPTIRPQHSYNDGVGGSRQGNAGEERDQDGSVGNR